jgi:hypothetical protein
MKNESAEKTAFMLREPQHERKIVNVVNVIPVRPELRRRAGEGFSAESKMEHWSNGVLGLSTQVKNGV